MTWNSSGTIYIDKTSIPNANVFTVYPYLFQKTWPKCDIPRLKEVVAKLKQIGLSNLITLDVIQVIEDTSLDSESGHSILEKDSYSSTSNDVAVEAPEAAPEVAAAHVVVKSTNRSSDVVKLANKSSVDLSSSSWLWWFIDQR